MDDIDKAQAHIEKHLALQVEQARASATRYPIGECINCGERLTDGRRYCDGDCRDEFEHRERQLRRTGVK
jgi:predicted nucleic acid-binding Zn ribbon protein